MILLRVGRTRKSSGERMNQSVERLVTRVSEGRWRLVSAATLLIIFFEIFEIVYKNEPLYDPFHLTELIIYIVILLCVVVLINFLSEKSAKLNHTLEILNYKHNVSLDLTKPEDWELHTTKLVMLPKSIADVTSSELYLRNPLTGQLDLIATWNAEGSRFEINDCSDCQNYLEEQAGAERSLSPCLNTSADDNSTLQSPEYCLPIVYADRLLALLHFKLAFGQTLSPQQFEIFESIRPELALSLKASQEQQRHVELERAETALAERHFISSYLHDNLSQNLAYLCLKLDQRSMDPDSLMAGSDQADLERMKETANQSYKIVRDLIETHYPKTTPRLNNLLSEYAAKVSQQADIKISIAREGEPLPMSPEIQQTVFYIYQEALSNVVKHSGADHVDVLIQWAADRLTVSITDNGIGFDPHSVDEKKHFGLAIMKERVARVDGQIEFLSSKDTGTTAKLSLPVFIPVKRGIREGEA